jgi:hypothetical protein
MVLLMPMLMMKGMKKEQQKLYLQLQEEEKVVLEKESHQSLLLKMMLHLLLMKYPLLNPRTYPNHLLLMKKTLPQELGQHQFVIGVQQKEMLLPKEVVGKQYLLHHRMRILKQRWLVMETPYSPAEVEAEQQQE